MAEYAKDDAARLTEARKRWAKCSDAEEKQRSRILKAKQFRALDQWDPAIKVAREGGASISGMAPQPPRPCLVVDRLSQPVRQISNTIKNADFGFDVLPNGGGADIETAEIFKGILRRVQNQARGESPLEWAADGAIEGGLGWFRLRTEYVHEQWDGEPGDPEAFDQELRMERIANNLTVYCDPSANRPTRSDALWMFVTEDLDREEFLDLYDSDPHSLDAFVATGDMQGWVSDDTIRIAEYWTVTFTNTQIWMLEDGTGGTGAPPKGVTPKMSRTMRVPAVTMCKINACEVLKKKGGEKEEHDWVGSRIPLIPILGEELNVDGKPVLRGVIEMGMDAQRMVNYTYSAGVEIFALDSRKAPMVAAESIQNYKQIWDTRTTYGYSYLPYDPWDSNGRELPRPQLDTTEAPIQAAVMLMRTSEEAIKASTSTGDASLGNTNPNERSGRALQQLQQQSDLANSNYPDNVRRALIYAAEMMVEIIPKITRPGQIIHIMGLDDEPDQVMVGQPFTKGPDGVPVKADVPPEVAKQKEALATFYDLARGRYAVTVTVGKASATKREEGALALGDLIPHLPPEMAAVATPDYVRQLSFPGAQKIAEKLENTLPPNLQPKKDGEQGPDPAMLMQQLQQAQQQLQEAGKIIETEQVKQQATMQKAQLDAQSDLQKAHMEGQIKLEIAKMDNATKLQIEEYKMRGAAMQAELDAREAQLGAEQQQATQASQQAHEAGMAAMGSVEARERDEQGAARQADEAEAGRAHEAAMAQQAQQAMQAAAAPEGA